MLAGAPVPAEGTLCRLVSIGYTPQEVHIQLPVFWVDIVEALLVAHAPVRQEVAVQIHGDVLLQVEANHEVIARAEGALHDGREVFCALGVMTYSQQRESVDHPTED